MTPEARAQWRALETGMHTKTHRTPTWLTAIADGKVLRADITPGRDHAITVLVFAPNGTGARYTPDDVAWLARRVLELERSRPQDRRDVAPDPAQSGWHDDPMSGYRDHYENGELVERVRHDAVNRRAAETRGYAPWKPEQWDAEQPNKAFPQRLALSIYGPFRYRRS